MTFAILLTLGIASGLGLILSFALGYLLGQQHTAAAALDRFQIHNRLTVPEGAANAVTVFGERYAGWEGTE